MSLYFSALLIENEDGSQMRLSAFDPSKREAAAKQLLVPKNIHHGPNSQKKVCTLKEQCVFCARASVSFYR